MSFFPLVHFLSPSELRLSTVFGSLVAPFNIVTAFFEMNKFSPFNQAVRIIFSPPFLSPDSFSGVPF